MFGQLLYVIAFLGVIIDRIFKDIYVKKLPESGVLYLEDFAGGVGFLFAKNTGAAFSLAIPQIVLIVIVVLVLLYVIHMMNRYRLVGKIFISGSLALIVAGGLSNLVDRLIYGGVVDYIKIFVWPIFNIADVMIVVGVLLWMWYLVAVNE